MVVTVPLALCLSKATALKVARKRRSPPELRQIFENRDLSDEDAIAFFLLRERALGNASDWAPYIASLPLTIPQGATFSSEALETLQDDTLSRQFLARGQSIAKRFRDHAPALAALAKTVGPEQKSSSGKKKAKAKEERGKESAGSAAAKASTSSKAPSLFSKVFGKKKGVEDEEAAAAVAVSAEKAEEEPGAGPPSPDSFFTVDAYQWALAVVSSRALTFRGERFLAPICDMFNYAPHPNTRQAASGEFYLEHHLLNKQGSPPTLTVLADRTTPALTQVFEDYGDNPSSLYLDHHGFVPAENPFDCVGVTLESLGDQGKALTIQQAGLAQEVGALLRRLRVPPSPRLCIPAPPPLPPPPLAGSAGASGSGGEKEGGEVASSLVAKSAPASPAAPALPPVFHWGVKGTEYMWLTAQTMNQNQVHACMALLTKRAEPGITAEEISELGAQVAEGVCPLLSGGNPHYDFPPNHWAGPTLDQLRSFILPALHKRSAAGGAAGSDSNSRSSSGGSDKGGSGDEEVAGGGGVAVAAEVSLALEHRSKQTQLLSALLEFGIKSAAAASLGEERSPAENEAREVEVAPDGSVAAASPGGGGGGGSSGGGGSGGSTRWSSLGSSHPDCEGTTADESFNCAVAAFNEWVKGHRFPVQLIEARPVPGMRVGAIATADIEPEQLYLSVPSSAVMDASSAASSRALVEAGVVAKARQSPDPDFFALLFHLLYEAKVLGSESAWWPYLRLLPNLNEINPPSEYGEEEMALLKGSSVHSAVRAYQRQVQQHWSFMSDDAAFGPATRALFGPTPFTLDEPTFRWAHYVLNSRAIWWGSGRHLVPLLDLINCAEGPGLFASRVHATRLDSPGLNADTRAPWAFPNGSQVFENYGQPNHIYFQYHGFVLDSNTHDCVSVSASITKADPGMASATKTSALRHNMKRLGFASGTQSFCVANPAKLAAAKENRAKASLSAQQSQQEQEQEQRRGFRVPASEVADSRLLAFLALKHGKPLHPPPPQTTDPTAATTPNEQDGKGEDSDEGTPFYLNSALKALLLEAASGYPEREEHAAKAEAAAVAAGAGVGGGRGADHPAVKLLAREKHLLLQTAEVL